MSYAIVFLTLFWASSGLCQQRFCPSATPERPRCEADLEQYKCGVFFLDLPGKEQLSWIGALPDIFKKRSVAQSPEIRATLAGAKPESFILTPDQCSDNNKLSNARCFTIMTKLRSTPFQNCTKNVINDGGADTLGNILCEKMARFYNGEPPLDQMKRGITIGFFHSECGKEWVPTGNPASPLTGARRLCCIKDESSQRFLQVDCRGSQQPLLTC